MSSETTDPAVPPKRSEVIRGYSEVPLRARGAVVGIGNFDGLHKGHRSLIDVVLRTAAQMSAPSGLIAFSPHPREFFRPEHPHFRLTERSLWLELVAGLGLDCVFEIPFDAALAGMSPEEFVERVLKLGLGVRHVVVGEDFRFGKARAGDVAQLEALAKSRGIGVTAIRKIGAVGGAPFGSSAIREQLEAGNVAGAALGLGRPWRVRGVVSGGDRRGRELGFPTANIELQRGTRLAHGIYAARVRVGNAWHGAAAYFGARPQFDNGAPRLEVFLLDYTGDLYGKTIDVEFIDRVREDRAFADVGALKEQMARDVMRTRDILAGTKTNP